MQYAPSEPWAAVGGPTIWTTCPTSMSGHSRRKWPSCPHHQHSGPGIWGTPCGSGRTVTEPGTGGEKRTGWDARWNSPWPPGRGYGSHMRGKPSSWCRHRLLPLRVGGTWDEVILGQGYGSLETGGPVVLYPGCRGRGQPPQKPLHDHLLHYASSPGRSAVGHRRKGGPPLPGPAPGTATSVPWGCTPSGTARPFWGLSSSPVLMGEGCGLPAVLPPTRVAIGAPPTPPVANGRLLLPLQTPPGMPGHRRPPTFLGGVCWASCCCCYLVPRPLPAAAVPASGALLAPSAAPSARRARLPVAPVQPPSPPALWPVPQMGLAYPALCLLFSFSFFFFLSVLALSLAFPILATTVACCLPPGQLLLITRFSAVLTISREPCVHSLLQPTSKPPPHHHSPLFDFFRWDSKLDAEHRGSGVVWGDYFSVWASYTVHVILELQSTVPEWGCLYAWVHSKVRLSLTLFHINMHTLM